MWRETGIRPSSQAPSRHRGAKHSPKRAQLAQAVVANQDERTATGLATKADGAVERNFEGFDPHIRGSIVRSPETLLGQAAEKEERDVQSFRLNQSAAQIVGAPKNGGTVVDLCCGTSIGNSSEKQPIGVEKTTVHDTVYPSLHSIEHTMNAR